MDRLSLDDPGTQVLLDLLRSGALRPLLDMKLPDGADLVLVERQKAARELHEAWERGADLDEIGRLGDRLLAVCGAGMEGTA